MRLNRPSKAATRRKHHAELILLSFLPSKIGSRRVYYWLALGATTSTLLFLPFLLSPQPLKMRYSVPVALTLSLSATVVSGLWPLPTPLVGSTSLPNATVKLASGFSISGPDGGPSDLADAVARTSGFILSDKLAALTPGGGSEYSDKIDGAPELTKLTLSFTGNGSASIATEANKPFRERSEGYELIVPAEGGEATLKANSSLGKLPRVVYVASVLNTSLRSPPRFDNLRTSRDSLIIRMYNHLTCIPKPSSGMICLAPPIHWKLASTFKTRLFTLTGESAPV